MRGVATRLAALEARQPVNRARCICIKATDGQPADVGIIMQAAGLEPRAADTVVIINKPAGTGGADRVLSWELLR